MGGKMNESDSKKRHANEHTSQNLIFTTTTTTTKELVWKVAWFEGW